MQRLVFTLLAFAASAGAIRAQSVETRTVEAASEVLREVMDIPGKAIPATLLADAHGVVIIPDMVKGGFIVGGRYGKGVIVARNDRGEWLAPVFITVTGGSFGFQAGLEATDVVAVFRNRQGVDRLMRGKLTIGADASVAAGPVGRDASAATNGQLKAEILSYSRSRGLFAGVAFDGAVMAVNHRAMAAYYEPRPGQPQGAVPVSAVKLAEQIAFYADPKSKPALFVKEVPVLPAPHQADEVEAIRAQLAESSVRLHKVLDPQWHEFLALPADFYAEGKTPSKETFARWLDRYNVVTSDARYQNLSSRPEFRETHALLLRFHSALEGRQASAMKLPPPPR